MYHLLDSTTLEKVPATRERANTRPTLPPDTVHPSGCVWAQEIEQPLPDGYDSELHTMRRLDDIGARNGDVLEYHTKRYELVDRVIPVPESVPKYLLVSLLEERGFQNIETQIENAFQSLPEPPRSRADRGWRMESRIRRDNSMVSLIQASIKRPDGSQLTDEEMDAVFIAADSIN